MPNSMALGLSRLHSVAAPLFCTYFMELGIAMKLGSDGETTIGVNFLMIRSSRNSEPYRKYALLVK